MSDLNAYEFAVAYSLAMLWLGFWLGRLYYGWRAARLRRLLELERVLNRTGTFPLPWSDAACRSIQRKVTAAGWRGGRL